MANLQNVAVYIGIWSPRPTNFLHWSIPTRGCSPTLIATVVCLLTVAGWVTDACACQGTGQLLGTDTSSENYPINPLRVLPVCQLLKDEVILYHYCIWTNQTQCCCNIATTLGISWVEHFQETTFWKVYTLPYVHVYCTHHERPPFY